MNKKGTWIRKIFFALIPALLVFAVATIVLHALESQEVIQTEGVDDHVANPPVNLLTPFKEKGVAYYRLDDPFMADQSFSVKKQPGTVRIVMTGGSFAMGSPYCMQGQTFRKCGGGIPKCIEKELQLRFPKQKIEMLNFGAGSQNSTRVRFMMEKIVQLEPDLIIVATGNNEGVIPSTSINLELHKWVVYRAMKKALIKPAKLWERSYFTPKSSGENVNHQFKKNMTEIVQIAQDADKPLILATLPINLKFILPPHEYKIIGVPDPMEDEDIQKGRRAFLEGNYQQAIESYSISKVIDFSFYFIGEAFEAMGDLESAKLCYRMYVNKNSMNRTNPIHNEFIRQLCRDKQIPLADLEQAFETLYPGQIPSTEHFLDFCHMTWMGYYLMSKPVIKVILDDKRKYGLRGKPLPDPTLDVIKTVCIRDMNELPLDAFPVSASGQ